MSILAFQRYRVEITGNPFKRFSSTTSAAVQTQDAKRQRARGGWLLPRPSGIRCYGRIAGSRRPPALLLMQLMPLKIDRSAGRGPVLGQ